MLLVKFIMHKITNKTLVKAIIPNLLSDVKNKRLLYTPSLHTLLIMGSRLSPSLFTTLIIIMIIIISHLKASLQLKLIIPPGLKPLT